MNTTLPAKRGPGCPPKWTPRTVRTLLRCIERGMPYKHACHVVRISVSGFFAMKAKDAQFNARVQQALAKGIEERLAVVEACTKSEDPAIALRAATWYLEHIAPEHFARNRIEVSGPDGAPLAAAVAIFLPQKQDSNGGHLPAVNAPALLAERTANGNG